MIGRIKKYNKEKGYGFIISEDGNDYFFHISDVKTMVEIALGQIVEFSLKETAKGKAAYNVEIKQKIDTFISCEGINIKKSNIKSYYICTAKRHFLKLYKKNPLLDLGGVKSLFEPRYVHSDDKYIIEPDDLYHQGNIVRIRLYDEEKKEYIWTSDLYQYKDGKIISIGGDIDWNRDIGVMECNVLGITTYSGETYEFNDYMDKESFEKLSEEIKNI